MCAQGRCATRLRYAPTFYLLDSKPLLGTVQGPLPGTVPKPCQNAIEDHEPCQNSKAAISISYGRWGEDAELASEGSVGQQKVRAPIGPLQSHDSIAHRASNAHLLLRRRSNPAAYAAGAETNGVLILRRGRVAPNPYEIPVPPKVKVGSAYGPRNRSKQTQDQGILKEWLPREYPPRKTRRLSFPSLTK